VTAACITPSRVTTKKKKKKNDKNQSYAKESDTRSLDAGPERTRSFVSPRDDDSYHLAPSSHGAYSLAGLSASLTACISAYQSGQFGLRADALLSCLAVVRAPHALCRSALPVRWPRMKRRSAVRLYSPGKPGFVIYAPPPNPPPPHPPPRPPPPPPPPPTPPPPTPTTPPPPPPPPPSPLPPNPPPPPPHAPPPPPPPTPPSAFNSQLFAVRSLNEAREWVGWRLSVDHTLTGLVAAVMCEALLLTSIKKPSAIQRVIGRPRWSETDQVLLGRSGSAALSDSRRIGRRHPEAVFRA